jgi:hypothetical protein
VISKSVFDLKNVASDLKIRAIDFFNRREHVLIYEREKDEERHRVSERDVKDGDHFE